MQHKDLPTPANLNNTPALPPVLKHRNRQLVLECFRDHQEHTVADIVARTGISKLTVMRAIQYFCGKKVLVSSGKGESTEQGGKKPEYFRFACHKYLLTIMMWPESLRVTLFDMNQREIKRSAFDWIIPASPEEAFSFIEELSMSLLGSLGLQVQDLYGVNLSTSGIIDYNNQVLKYSVHSPEWGNDIPVGQYLQRIFGETPFYLIENAGKCISRTILGEQEDPNKRVLMLFTSWGLSGSMIQNGRILNGRDSLIGEIGHIILDPTDQELCICGSYGCLERLVSVARLRKRIAADPPPASSPLAKLPPEAITLHHLFFASQQEDAYARGYVTYLADCFAVLLRNVALVFNPEKVVFVGDYAVADAFFDQRIQQHFQQFHYLASSSPIEVVYDSRSLPDMDARGGAIALLDHFFADPQLYEDP